MLNYLKNPVSNPISYIRRKILPITAACAIVISGCSYDVMDGWHRLRKRELKQEQRVQREINKLDDIDKERTNFKNALESALEEMKRTEENTMPEEGTENE